LRAVPPQPVLLVGYLGASALLYAPAWASPTTTVLRGGSGDPAIFIWFLRWTPFAVDHGRPLLFTDHLNVPDGVNLMWNTSVPLLGLVFAPLTARWGPVLTLNVIFVLAHGLSAWTAYLAIRRYVPGHLAAAAGGLVFGFSPAILSQGGHPHMSFAVLVPPMLLAVDEIVVRQRRPPWLAGPLLGLLAGCQLLIGEELLAATVLFGVLLVLVVVLNDPRAVLDRRRVLHALLAFTLAAVVGLAIAAWPLAVQFTGPQRVHGDIITTNYSNDLLGFAVPASPQRFLLHPGPDQVRQLAGGNTPYLGAPILLALAALVLRRWRLPVVRVGAAMLLLAAVFSMGPYLHVDGRATAVTLPWAPFDRMATIASLIPSRLAIFTALFAGLLLAVLLRTVWEGGGWRRLAAVGVAAAAVAPLLPSRPVPADPVGTPTFFTGGALRRLPEGGVTLVLPYASRRLPIAMTWQAEAGMRFRMPGGFFIGPSPDGRARFDASPNAASRAFGRIQQGRAAPRLTGGMRRVLAADLTRWGVATVVVGPMDHQATMLGFLTDLFGGPPESVGGVWLWRDPLAHLPARSAGPDRPGAIAGKAAQRAAGAARAAAHRSPPRPRPAARTAPGGSPCSAGWSGRSGC
jgi:hypothetical protein